MSLRISISPAAGPGCEEPVCVLSDLVNGGSHAGGVNMWLPASQEAVSPPPPGGECLCFPQFQYVSTRMVFRSSSYILFLPVDFCFPPTCFVRKRYLIDMERERVGSPRKHIYWRSSIHFQYEKASPLLAPSRLLRLFVRGWRTVQVRARSVPAAGRLPPRTSRIAVPVSGRSHVIRRL